MTGPRPGTRAENYKSPARGITGKGRPAWSEAGRGKAVSAGNERTSAAGPLVHLWFMQRKTPRSAERSPLAQPQAGFLHRRPFGIAPGQATIEFPNGCPLLEVLAGSLIKGGSPLRDVRCQRWRVFRSIHSQ